MENQTKDFIYNTGAVMACIISIVLTIQIFNEQRAINDLQGDIDYNMKKGSSISAMGSCYALYSEHSKEACDCARRTIDNLIKTGWDNNTIESSRNWIRFYCD